MSDEYYDDDEDAIEEWEYVEEEVKDEVAFKDRISIWDIIKLVLLFVAFAGFFIYFRFWDFFAGLLRFGGSEELGNSRLLYATFILFPLAAGIFLKYLADVSTKLFIPPKETAKD